MIAVDTNILVYAHRRESRFHEKAKDTVTALAEGGLPWSIPWPCLYEFFAVVTHPKIWKEKATPPDRASAQIDAWIGSPTVSLLTETAGFFSILKPLVERPRVRGPIVHDARIVALCLAHGVDELLSKDRDFQLFPELKSSDPFL